MKTRIIVAAIGLPLLLAVVLVLPPVATAILVAAMSVIAVYELLIGTGLVKHVRIFAYSSLMAVLICVWSWLGMPRAFGTLSIVVYLCALFGEMLAAHTQLRLRTVCIAIFAGVVVPFLLSALVRLRVFPHGRFYILTAFLLSMFPDTGAYFVGIFFGKRQLCPTISPNKTVEGALGGIGATVICMILYTLILQLAFKFQVNYFYAVLYGILGSLASTLFGLAASGFLSIGNSLNVLSQSTLLLLGRLRSGDNFSNCRFFIFSFSSRGQTS